MVTQPTARHTGENATEAAFRRQVTALKDGVRIEEVAAEYGNFRPTGTSRLLGRCLSPSHEDRTPSMTIYTDRQKFRCYSCGERGDAIDLEMLVNPGMEIQEAMVSLSLRYGVPLPERSRAWLTARPARSPYGSVSRRRRSSTLESSSTAWCLRHGFGGYPRALARQRPIVHGGSRATSREWSTLEGEVHDGTRQGAGARTAHSRVRTRG